MKLGGNRVRVGFNYRVILVTVDRSRIGIYGIRICGIDCVFVIKYKSVELA